jgi:hypothetical protein
MDTADLLNESTRARALVEERVEQQARQQNTAARMAALTHAMALQSQRGSAFAANKVIEDAEAFLTFLLALPPK